MKNRRAAIVGVAESDVGKTPHLSVMGQQAAAARAALTEAGLGFGDVDALFTAGRWSWSPVLSLAEYLGLKPSYLNGSNLGGSSFESHVGHAAAAIDAGLIDVALVTYGSTQRTDPANNGPSDITDVMASQFEAPFGVPLPLAAYGLAANRYLHQYGVTGEELAEVAVSARKWAAFNPKAPNRKPITAADVLDSPMICDPLHKLDCCLLTDGGGALVIAAEDRWPDLATRPVEIMGHSDAVTHASIANMPDVTVTAAAQSGPAATQMAGVTTDDIDLLEIYDSFTITVLLSLESLGICQPGEAVRLFTEGHAGPGGSTPMNTDGGGLSYTHPGMYGIYLLIEAVRQLRHDYTGGQRQVADAELALVHGTGGMLSSTSTVILGRV